MRSLFCQETRVFYVSRRFYKGPPQFPTLNQMNPLVTLLSYFFEILSLTRLLILTLRLLISYIYGAPSNARNANVVYTYIYGPTFGNAETVSFYLLHNVSTLNQCREVSCVTFVCKHFAS